MANQISLSNDKPSKNIIFRRYGSETLMKYYNIKRPFNVQLS
jgi:hypothetical protein